MGRSSDLLNKWYGELNRLVALPKPPFRVI
jgi:hypothetical protein